ncbi:telomere length regulation protein TEL2 homolog [Liolophura sinensis]|uniref:telomere length regulation protein TEL2 homolog n=1 Tax=Liolophura sinensis TaxID=3198878 RepID=UPI0031585928
MGGEIESHARVRAYVREQWNALSSSSDADQKITILRDVACLLPTSATKSHPEFKDTESFNKARDIFTKYHYSRFAGNLLDLLSHDWVSDLPRKAIRNVIDEFYLKGSPQDVFPILCTAVYTSPPSYKQSKSVFLLEEFFRLDLLKMIFLNQVEKHSVSTSETVSQAEMWDELVSLISSFPDKMANALKKQISQVFMPSSYIRIISTCLVEGLEKCHMLLLEGKDCSLEFSSQVLGKLCLSGYSETLWKHLLPSLLVFVRRDFVWVRLCERLITGIPDRCMESVIIPVLTSVPWFGMVESLLGDSVVHKHKLQYLLCTKLLLMRYFEQTLLLQNVLGYLASSHTRKPLFKSCMIRVLQVWVDGSAIKRTSYQQHYYLSKALLICLSFVKEGEQNDYQECLGILMRGMQSHLGSSDPKIRSLGMVVAESLTRTLQPHGPQLTFEVDKDESSAQLISLLVPPEDPHTQQAHRNMSGLSLAAGDHRGEVNSGDEVRGSKLQVTTQPDFKEEELDSDDDFQPYDLSDDIKVTEVMTPHYIRDCMEGLIKPESPDQTEACLRAAGQLIRTNPDGLTEISVEFMKILLHLSDEESIPEFSALRFQAMVALTTCCPAQVAEYLTGEFYGENYNLRQRLDILEVLSRAAQDLASPVKQGESDRPKAVQQVSELSSPESWQDVVRKRIEQKTRRFAKGSSQPKPVSVANKFAPVAGLFFFPLLLQYDRKQNTLDLLGRDSLVLSRLVYTLGVVIHAAVHTPIVRQMGATGLEFIWALRYHGDGSVRLSVLFTCAMLFLSVPANFLVNELQQEVTEVKHWLQDVAETDVNTECRKLALQALILLDAALTQEFQSATIS